MDRPFLFIDLGAEPEMPGFDCESNCLCGSLHGDIIAAGPQARRFHASLLEQS